MIPHDFPPWHTVYDQTQRWLRAGSFEVIVHDLRALLRLAQDWNAQPSAVILDARTLLQSTPESGSCAGYDGHKRKRGSKTHIAVDTLGHLLAMVVTAAYRRAGGRHPRRRWDAVLKLSHSLAAAVISMRYTMCEPSERGRAGLDRPDSDERYLVMAAAMDRDAFAELYEHYRPRIYAYLLTYMAGDEAA